MMANFTLEGEVDLCFAGYGTKDAKPVIVEVNFDYSPGREATRHDPPEPTEVSVNSVKLFQDGAEIACPDWLEKLILNAIDEDALCDHAREESEGRAEAAAEYRADLRREDLRERMAEG